MSKNANNLPGNPRVKADPFTQREIARRSPKFGETGEVIHTPAGVFYAPKKGGRAAVVNTPFKLTAYATETGFAWKVGAKLSHITNGTNGAKIDLLPDGADWKVDAIQFETETPIEESALIVLQAAVDPDLGLALSDWELLAIPVGTPEDAVEVGIDSDEMSSTFGKQIALRLLIGSVVIVEEPASATAYQAVFSPQMVTFGLFNSITCAVFQPAPVHPDFLTADNY